MTIERLSLPTPSTTLVTCSVGPAGTYASNFQIGWFANAPTGTLDADGHFLDPFNGTGLNMGSFGPFISSGEPAIPGAGLTFAPQGSLFSSTGIDQANVGDAYGALDFYDYEFTTSAALPLGSVIGQLYRFLGSGYQTTVYISDDPQFSTAVPLLSDHSFPNASNVAVRPDNLVFLEPSTTYYVRVVFYNATSGRADLDDLQFGFATCADYSDADSTYGSAYHAQIGSSALTLGATLTTDTGELSSALADGDTSGDDGITLPALTQGQTATITADVTGAGGFLQGWIDFDGSGTFDAGEQVATDLQGDGADDDVTANDGVITFDVNVPFTATTDQTFARFRWSTTAGLDATTAAPDGEVEDLSLIHISEPTRPY